MKLRSWVRALLVTLAVGTAVELVVSQQAEARAGRGRSSGRSSSSSSQQQQQYASPPPASAQQAATAPARGGFARGLAGGIAGGFLGSMLFSSLGHAGVGGAGGGGGGIGLIEILLFGGLAYLGFRWWKSRQQAAAAFAGVSRPGSFGASPAARVARGDSTEAIDWGRWGGAAGSPPAAIDADDAADVFFKIQGAWARRDIGPMRDLASDAMLATFRQDMDELRRDGRINRLENITVRKTEVVSSWQEDGTDLSTVRFTANLLDYTVDEASGRVVEGSDSEPVKFEEEWTFARSPATQRWQLVGIQQV